ncbi:MAG: glycoside hydrolase family 3 C-terminal domain-containing protein, partial [Clostridia bacterium]|nr:glycoside hydrolase family 3 C-terminal domain-containing protein [Clostridia bacterium]
MTATMAVSSISAAAEGIFNTEYASYDAVVRREAELNKTLAGEGFILFKNNNNALPLKDSEKKISLLGGNAYQTQTGGGGSGQSNPPTGTWVTEEATTILQSLDAAGFKTN